MKTATRLNNIKEYYFSRKLREVGEMIKDGKPIINMGIGSPDLDPHPDIVNALEKSILEPKAHMYQNYQGIPELRKSITEFYKTYYDVDLDPDSQVLPLMGSKEGIMHISMAYLNPGDEVLIPNPGYPTYASVTRLMQARAVTYDLKLSNNWQPDFKELENLDTSKVKIMWLNYPHMPTGAEFLESTFSFLVKWAYERNILLVNDNPYSFILTKKPKSILSIPGAEAVAVELNSLSKSFNMAGWRIGMLSGKKSVISEVLKVKSNMDSGMFFGIQKGAIAALKMKPEWFEKLNEIYNKRKELILILINKIGAKIESKSVGLFLWAKIPKGNTSAEEFIDKILYEKNIFITPGTVFGLQGEGYIRFSLCVPEAIIIEAINRFKS